MMDRKIKLSFILVLVISFIIFGSTSCFAAEANIVATSTKVGGDVIVTVTLPNECNEYQGRIKVVFADGAEKTSDLRHAATNTDGIPDNNFSRTISYTVKADVVGNGTAKMVDIVLGDGKGNKINTKDTVQTGFKVTASDSNDDNTNTNTNTVTNTVTDDSKDTNTVTNEVKEEKKEEIKVTIKEEVKKTMYVAEDVSSCNVRNADSKKAEIIGGLKRGAEVEVTGITSNGWYRIKYYGETAYVADVLSNEKPEKIEEDNEKNEVSNEVTNTADDTNTIENNTDELEKLKNEIGVIPEVGNNITDVLFMIVTIFSIGYVFYINNKNRNIEE